MVRTRVSLFLTFLAAFLAVLPARSASGPTEVRVAWLDGRTLADAAATKAVLLDRFPDAVLVADEASAKRLAEAGWRVEPPVAIPAGVTVTLLHARRAEERPDAAAFAAHGATLAWSGGLDAIAFSDGPLAEDDALLRHERKALREEPLRVSATRPLTGPAKATDFAPVVQTMVNQFSGTDLITGIGNLAGARSVLVGGVPVTFTTRSTPTTKCDQAEQYVYERFQAMGFTDVQYDPYTFSSTSARNVVATLPGVERPGQVVVIGGHLDSTSPQASTNAPGANDNASGAATVLQVAQILRQYSFKNTIRFIAFTGEEQGLYGSAHYANAAAARGDTIIGAVILDMTAWYGTRYQLDIEGETAWLPIMNVMNDACARYTSLATQIQLTSWGSDHVSFQDVGYPSFLAIESDYDAYPCYHQTCDTTGWNTAAFGGDVAKACLATTAQLAGPMDFYVAHTPLGSTENTTGPYEVVATIAKLSPLVADSLQLHWSTGSNENVALLTPTGVANQYHAYIPGQPATSRVTYWLSAADDQGRHAYHPQSAPASANSFIVGTRVTALSEGFEGAATGWTHGGTNDDWQFGTPTGLQGDPASAYAGTRVAGNDLTGLGGYLQHYENSSENWLESPAVDCSNLSGVHLSFARWLGIERSSSLTWDWARVQVNGTTAWESPSDANLVETAWALQDLDVSALADGHASVKVRFTLHSDGSVNYCGWNLDEVKLSGMSSTITADATPTPRPQVLALRAATPNPVHGVTTLRFDLPHATRVTLALYDVRGRLVRTLASGERDAGTHAETWDGRDAGGAQSAPGVYFARLTVDGASRSQRLVLLH